MILCSLPVYFVIVAVLSALRLSLIHICDEEYAACEANLEANGWQVDYVLTHDAPSRFLDFTSLAVGESNRLHLFLDKVLLKLTYEKWFFGCYHKDVVLSTKSRCVFCDVIPMGCLLYTSI